MALYKYKNSKVWWIDFIFDGVRVRESTKSRNKKLAQEIERKRRTDLESGRAGIRKQRRAKLFKVVSEEYLDVKRSVLSPRGLIIEQSNLKHLLSYFGTRFLPDIGAVDINAYQQQRLALGAAPKTVNLELGTLRAILIRHRLWEFIKQDVRMLRAEETVGRALSKGEEASLLSACAESRSRTLYPAVVLALNSGMRSMEIRLMRWHQVDLTEKMVRVGRSKTDAGAGRRIPLNATSCRTMNDWSRNFPARELDDFVFPSERYGQNGAPYAIHVDKPMGSFKEGWEAARRRSKVTCRFHDLRHTACTRLLEAGVPFALLAQIMGWSASSSVKMAKRYGHIGDDSLRHALELLDQSDSLSVDERGAGWRRKKVATENSPESYKASVSLAS